MPRRKPPDPGRRLFPFHYFVTRKEERTLKVNQRRDLGATLELLPALLQQGYVYDRSILNYPPTTLPKGIYEDDFEEDDLFPEEELFQVDLGRFRPGDLLLQTTRPPLDDKSQADRKKVARGYTNLEKRLLKVWRRYLALCSRSCIRLARDVRSELPERYRTRREMHFFQGILAPYKELNAFGGRMTPAPENTTAAFLLRVEEAWEGGPGLLGAFAMDGTTTQIWAYRLARDYPELLERPGFVLAEMKCHQVPERPVDLAFADDWEIDILAEARRDPKAVS